MEVENETRLVLIGRTGNGKSATGNSLLENPNAFKSSEDLCSVTGKTVRMSKDLTDSKTLAVIDTPGLFDTNTPEPNIIEELVRCIGLSSPGPHAFLYVLPVGNRLTNEEFETLQKYVRFFGEKLYKFLIIVFTYKSKLKGKRIQDYANNAPIFFTNFLKSCNNRIIAIENDNHEEDRRQTVRRLLKLIQEMKCRSEPFYIHEMYSRAENAIAKRMVELGRGATRKVVLDEIEAGGEGFNVLLAAGIGVIVGGILVAAGVLIGVVAAGATATAAATGATGLAVGGTAGATTGVVAAGATTGVVAAGATTGVVAAGSTGLTVAGSSTAAGAAPTAAVALNCVIM